MSIVSNIVGRLHVSASNVDVIRAVRRAFSAQAMTKRHRKQRRAIYREALRVHAANRDLYRYVMNGGH